jgi:hypothetical protein
VDVGEPFRRGVEQRHRRFDEVEPGRQMARAFELAGLAQEFLAQLEDRRRWDRAQATFSLQSVPSDERVGVLRALREHTDVVTIAEFDVPEHVEGSPEHVRSLVTRYERGIAEYGDDAQLVARGFLLPVVLGQVDPRVSRTNWEQPAEKWAEHAEASFTGIDIEPADYWWAPAVLINAT